MSLLDSTICTAYNLLLRMYIKIVNLTRRTILNILFSDKIDIATVSVISLKRKRISVEITNSSIYRIN